MHWGLDNLGLLQWQLVALAGVIIGAVLLFRLVVIFVLEAVTDIVKKARECLQELRKPLTKVEKP